MSIIVQQYAEEAVNAYNHRLYLASAVMLGVASETAFNELADSFLKTLSGKEEQNFSNALKRQNHIVKFTEFRKRLEGKKPDLPPDFVDGMDITMNAVQDVLRIYRNEAGHPTGKKIDSEECFINLQMFIRYLKKMYELKNHFDKKSSNP